MKCSDCPEYEICSKKYDLRKVRPRCKKNRTPKVLTNADKIRSMTDEELAVFLDKFSSRCIDCVELGGNKNCPICKDHIFCEIYDIMEWLKQQAGKE